MSGKVKDLHGVYKALGRDAFLFAALNYTNIEPLSVDKTLLHMEGTWEDEALEITEADRMVSDYQLGYISKDKINEEMKQENDDENQNDHHLSLC